MAHPFDQLVKWPDKQESDNVLIQAIVFMSATTHTHLTMQAIYDMLLADANKKNTEVLSTGVSSDPILHRILGKMNVMEQSLHNILDSADKMEQRIANQFRHLEDTLTTATDRLSNDVQTLQSKVATLQTAFDAQSKAVNDANTRFGNEISTLNDLVKQLRDNAGSGNEDAINAIADKVEASTSTIGIIADGLTASATQEDTLEQAAPAPVTLSISPATVTLAPGATQQFSANVPVTWKSNPDLGRNITADGLYIAPASATSDTVTATTMDGTQSMSASISIVAA